MDSYLFTHFPPSIPERGYTYYNTASWKLTTRNGEK